MDAQIGRPDYDDAVAYLLQRAAGIRRLASGRPDLAVEVLTRCSLLHVN